jgi:hypothetical protein
MLRSVKEKMHSETLLSKPYRKTNNKYNYILNQEALVANIMSLCQLLLVSLTRTLSVVNFKFGAIKQVTYTPNCHSHP